MVCSKTECDNLALHGEHKPGEACYLRNTLEHVGDKIKESVYFSADIKFGAMLADYAAKNQSEPRLNTKHISVKSLPRTGIIGWTGIVEPV